MGIKDRLKREFGNLPDKVDATQLSKEETKMLRKETVKARKALASEYTNNEEKEKGEEIVEKVSKWYFIYWISFILCTIALLGMFSSFFVALANRFPESEAGVLMKYSNIMNTENFIPASLQVIGYFFLFMDWAVCFYCLLTLKSEVVLDVLVYSNFTNKGFATFGFLVCTMISNYLLWFNFSPWYSFGLNIGALLFIMITNQTIGLGFIWSCMKCKTTKVAWRIAYERFDERCRMSWGEWCFFYLPANILQLHTIFLVFSSLFAAKTYWGNNLGLDDDQMYATLAGIFLFAGTLVVEVMAGLNVVYGFLAGLQFIGLTIVQADNVVNGVSVYPISWKASISYACVLIAASLIAVPFLMRRVNEAHKDCKTNGCRDGEVTEHEYREDQLLSCFGRIHKATHHNYVSMD